MNLEIEVFGRTFQNPVLLASGTCGYGQELVDYIDLDSLGGFVIKAVTVEERHGNPAPRVTEFGEGMLNSIGLANVGVDVVRDEKLPWLQANVKRAHVFVNVAGKTVDEFTQIITVLDGSAGFLAYELNVSCPNVKEGGAFFSSRPDLLGEVVARSRAVTKKPIVVKLAPNVPDIGAMARVAEENGADGLTLINTIPGMLFDVKTRKTKLGAGSGGVSGTAILPVGVHAVYQAKRKVAIPIIGVGGISSAEDAAQYFLAGASLVQVGTATFADPRAPERVLSGLKRLGDQVGAKHVRELIGAVHQER
ncbi:MAG TPA: dihydroorotate dehydrogenase [Longimicrobiales bacterium]|nr:dihydroorotate dehydrogenase [Longimicrobiales bacterium]